MTSPMRRSAPDRSGIAALRREVLRGLLGTPKTLPPKLFYDTAGAALFEQICALPEYYVTRTELGILREAAEEIAQCVGPDVALVEYGSGAGIKVRLLLSALDRPAAYLPIDISSEQLERVAEEVADAFPGVAVLPICADFTRPLRLPALVRTAHPMAFFPGSTIGNFHPTEAAAFLHRIRHTVGERGTLVLGVDRRKARAVLEAAYDDGSGVTAAFNRNMLVRLNRELGADFDLGAFTHRAVWNDEASRIEMHLVSRVAQTVRIGASAIAFEAGETIWTECSYKYDEASLLTLASAAGFRIERRWTDAAEQFWVVLLRAMPSGA